MSDCKVKLRKADRNVFLFIRRYHKAGELYEQEALGDLYNVPFNCRIGYMQRVDPGCSSAIEAAQYLNEGDVLIVRTLWGLGNDFDEIVNTLDYFHGKKYSLLIYDAYYLDDLYKSKESGSFHYISRDYDVLRNAISLFYRKKGKYREEKKSLPVRKGARGPKTIELTDYPKDIQNQIRDYCENRHYTTKELRKEFEIRHIPFPCDKVLRRLVLSMDDILLEEHAEEDRYYVFRSRLPRIRQGLPTSSSDWKQQNKKERHN